MLSPRELEVARLIAEDVTDREAANILRISVRTLHSYLDRIGKKLGAHHDQKRSRRHVIARWVRSSECPPTTESHAA